MHGNGLTIRLYLWTPRGLWLRYVLIECFIDSVFTNGKKYIEGELAQKIGLLTGKKALREKAFMTIENYVHMQNRLWINDFHDYVHEGSRVDMANLLNTHCFTSARCQELCQARYKVRHTNTRRWLLLTLVRICSASCHGKMDNQSFASSSQGRSVKQQIRTSK